MYRMKNQPKSSQKGGLHSRMSQSGSLKTSHLKTTGLLDSHLKEQVNPTMVSSDSSKTRIPSTTTKKSPLLNKETLNSLQKFPLWKSTPQRNLFRDTQSLPVEPTPSKSIKDFIQDCSSIQAKSANQMKM